MRSKAVNIIYLTDDTTKYDSFKEKCEAIGLYSLAKYSQPSAIRLSEFLSKLNSDLSTYLIIIDNEIKNSNFYLELHPIIVEYPEITFWIEGNPDGVLEKLFPITYEEGIKNFLENDVSIDESILFLREFLSTKTIENSYSNIAVKIKECFFNDDDGDIYDGEPESNGFLLGLYSDIRRYQAKQDLVLSLICIPSVYDIIKDENLRTLLKVGNNMFDAANLRYVIKQWKIIQLNCSFNYQKIESSRKSHVAICVEEENEQCYYNCYVLFANGYRSLPVTSATFLRELLSVDLKGERTIIRDFDLQFPDETQMSNNINEVDKIRGFKFDNEKQWQNFIDDKSEYWSVKDYSDNNVHFITYGYKGLVVEHNRSKVEISEDQSVLKVPGMTKPIIGIITPLSKYMVSLLKKTSSMRYSVKDEEYVMVLDRENHQHSAPLDLYDMASSMIQRAEFYFNCNNYLLSAIVSQEVVEMLNGFHRALSLQAYYVHVKAENALAINVLGGDDKILAEDATLRVKRIKEDIDRMLAEKEDDRSSSMKKKIRDATRLNVLNQLFSDCRLFCKEKEHFEAEDVFISEMAHINDGFSFSNIFKR